MKLYPLLKPMYAFRRRKPKPAYAGILFLIFFSAFNGAAQDKPFLSNLNADKNTPVFTTYAAAKERSNFILDEGYSFRFQADSLGADFITDTGGDLCLSFKMNGKWVYKIKDMYKAPVITTSYPDLVKYTFYPFEGIQVRCFFLVYHSQVAILDIQMINEGAQAAQLEVIPFLRNRYRAFGQVDFDPNNQQVSFSHQEYPDSWTIDHQLPHVDSIRNLFYLSEKMDASGVFNSENGEEPKVPFALHLDHNSTLQINGRLFEAGNQRVIDLPPACRLQLYVDDNPDRILTENSSVWGIGTGAIDNAGYYRMEAGILNRDAHTYRVAGLHETSGEMGYADGNFDGKNSNRVDLHLGEGRLPPVVETFTLTTKSKYNELKWEAPAPDLKYSVYRRDYPGDVYVRIASQIRETSFKDTHIEAGHLYGYVVAAHTIRGAMGIQSKELTTLPKQIFSDFVEHTQSTRDSLPYTRIIAFEKNISLQPGDIRSLRVFRAVTPQGKPMPSILPDVYELMLTNLQSFVRAHEKINRDIPVPAFTDSVQQSLYWNAVNLMQQEFYPAEGKSNHNYYVFSREPTWGWGHGGQVFHESLTMLAYAYVDPLSAMNSQRVFSQRQYANGYINYRTGAYLDEIIENNGALTSSAPWYAWINSEVYKITKDKGFLFEMYESSKKFYQYYTNNRDSDHDGLCEWGGDAVLESVRDALVAVWDQVGDPSEFEALDLNCMLVKEAKSLEYMAQQLGRPFEAAEWRKDYETRTELINRIFWDPENGFYYHADKKTQQFTHKTANDLKRDEIIGFLPLWAGVASKEQAASLVKHLTDPGAFWRLNGIPSLSASDPYYNEKGYWNGPVWVEWNYLITRGLRDYGYDKEATEITRRVASVMAECLRRDHTFWEFYSPDEPWGGYHQAYIWAGIINRMLLDN